MTATAAEMTAFLADLRVSSDARHALLAGDAELVEMAGVIDRVLTGNAWATVDTEAMDARTVEMLERADAARSRGMSLEALVRFADADRPALAGFLTIIDELDS